MAGSLAGECRKSSPLGGDPMRKWWLSRSAAILVQICFVTELGRRDLGDLRPRSSGAVIELVPVRRYSAPSSHRPGCRAPKLLASSGSRNRREIVRRPRRSSSLDRPSRPTGRAPCRAEFPRSPRCRPPERTPDRPRRRGQIDTIIPPVALHQSGGLMLRKDLLDRLSTRRSDPMRSF